MPMTLENWSSLATVAVAVGGGLYFVWSKVPGFSSQIEHGRVSDEREYINALRARYGWAYARPWWRMFWTRDFWATTLWQKARLAAGTFSWRVRKLRPEVDRPRVRYETRRPAREKKWKRPMRTIHVKMKDHLARQFQEVPALTDLAEGDVVYLLYRGHEYGGEELRKHKFPLYQVMNHGGLQRVENGEYAHRDADGSRYFWFKKAPRPLPAPTPAALPVPKASL